MKHVYINKNFWTYLTMWLWVANLISSYIFTGYMREIQIHSKLLGVALTWFFTLLLPLSILNLWIFIVAIKNMITAIVKKSDVVIVDKFKFIFYITVVAFPLTVFGCEGFINTVWVIAILYRNIVFGVPIY